jgi:hypothetical protein
MTNYQTVPSASKYRWFADQCIERAQSAKSPEEAVGYLQRAAIWRRLADARKDVDGEQGHFVSRRRNQELPSSPIPQATTR